MKMTSAASCAKILTQLKNLQHLLTSQPHLTTELKSIKCEDIFGKLTERIKSVKKFGTKFPKFMQNKRKD